MAVINPTNRELRLESELSSIEAELAATKRELAQASEELAAIRQTSKAKNEVRQTMEVEMNAGGLRGLEKAYWVLLTYICESGVVLKEIRTISRGWLRYLIVLKVEGTETEIRDFNKRWNS
jgi:hypothetical protein